MSCPRKKKKDIYRAIDQVDGDDQFGISFDEEEEGKKYDGVRKEEEG